MPLPQLTVTRTDQPAPLEGQDVPTGEGLLSSAEAGLESTLGASLVVKGIGAAYQLDPMGRSPVTHDQATAVMKQQGYDPSVLPDGDTTVGTLTALIGQQSAIRRSQDLANRARNGFAGTAAEFVGGAADPVFLLAGPALGRALGPLTAGAGRAVRAGVGAAEGAGSMTAYDIARQHVGTAPGDRDIGVYDMARDAAFGGLLGGGLAALHRPLTTADVRALERSDAAAVQQGVPVNEVRSPAGAVGAHQIMPENARPGEDLTDSATNERVAQRILDEDNSRFGGDGEASAIAYNAGPRWAKRWLAAGRDDSILPKETQGYVQRYRELAGVEAHADTPEAAGRTLPPDVMQDAARTAIHQSEGDFAVDVKSTVESSLDKAGGPGAYERYLADKDAPRPEPPVFRDDVIRGPARVFGDDPIIQDMLRQVGVDAKQAKPTAPTETGPLEAAEKPLTDSAVKEAKTLATRLGDTSFDTTMAEHEEAAKADESDTKAVEAALRCGATRGLF